MSLRLRIFGEDFGSRLCASLGAKEAFLVENWLCMARLVLALYCVAWTQLENSPLSPQPWRIQGLLNVFLIYSVLIFVLVRVLAVADASYRMTTLVIDFLFAAAITLFTGGPESPYSPIIVFTVLAAAYRWGLRPTKITAASCALLLFAEVIVFQTWPQYFEDPGAGILRTERLLLRSAFLIVASLLFGYLAVRERRLHAETVMVTRVLGHVQAGNELQSTVKTLVAELVQLYRPAKLLVALRNGNSEEAFAWESEPLQDEPQVASIRNVLQFSQLETAVFACSEHSWYYSRKITAFHPSFRSFRSLAFNSQGHEINFRGFEKVRHALPFSGQSSLMVTSLSFADASDGRLILVNPSVPFDNKQALHFLQNFAKRIVPVIETVYFLRDIRVQVEHQVRATLTRELHDGTLQSLLSAEMQIEVLRRQRPASASELDRRLAALQVLTHREALNLRDLIEKTKPLNFSPQELPDFLAELVAKFRLETGISVRLETGNKNRMLPASICHEVVRIVQEGLTNVRKHSGASNVVITFSAGEDGQHKLLIADDGHGFEFRGRVTHAQLEASHRGPGVIKERVRLIGGELTIDSSPGNWARLEISIPDDSRG